MTGWFDPLARMIAGRMLNSVIMGVVITIMVAAVLRIFKSSSSGTRFAIWFSVLIFIPAMPISVELFRSTSSTAALTRISLPVSWTYIVFAIWAGISAVGLLRLAIGIWRIRLLRRHCSPVDVTQLGSSVQDTIVGSRPERDFVLLQSERVRVPTAVGFFRPAVILPAWCLRELSEQELSAALIHEFGHLKRWDDWTNLFQKALHAVFFFHPAVWWLENRISLEREMACDELVLSATNNPRGYAQCLVSLAEKSAVQRSLTLAQAAVHRLHEMSLRVGQILEPRAPRGKQNLIPAVSIAIPVMVIGFAMSLRAPTLIGFQAAAPEREGSSFKTPFHERGLAKVVPASFSSEQGSDSRSKSQPSVIPAKLRPHRSLAKSSVIAFNRNSEMFQHHPVVAARFLPVRQMPVTSMLLVMDDQIVDSAGRVTRMVSVWRVTLYHPSPAAAKEGTVPSSI